MARDSVDGQRLRELLVGVRIEPHRRFEFGAFLGAKIHDPKDPGADLGPMFTQVVGTLFTLARKNVDIWRPVTGSHDVPVIGEVIAVEPEVVNASVRVLVEKFRASAADQDQAWTEILS